MKLALGTVQFGMPYGISNTLGTIPPSEVETMLRSASQAGIDLLDTARSYGVSEDVLGKILPNLSSFKIVTKSDHFGSPESLESSLNQSLKALKVDSVYGFLVHHTADFFNDPHGSAETLEKLKQEGKAKKIGASIYDPEEAHRLLKWFQPDIIQLPLNVLDQRAISLIQTLHSQGIEVHVRSVFLQGALLMEPGRLPATLGEGIGKIKKFHYDCRAQGVNPLVGALQFVKQQTDVDRIVVGCCSAEELRQILRAFNSAPLSLLYGTYSSTEGCNPSQW